MTRTRSPFERVRDRTWSRSRSGRESRIRRGTYPPTAGPSIEPASGRLPPLPMQVAGGVRNFGPSPRGSEPRVGRTPGPGPEASGFRRSRTEDGRPMATKTKTPRDPRREELRRLGERVREQRRGRGMTQETLAEALGLSVAYVSLIERGGRNPPYTTVVAIARALGVPATRI